MEPGPSPYVGTLNVRVPVNDVGFSLTGDSVVSAALSARHGDRQASE